MSKKNRRNNKGRDFLEPGLTIPVNYVRTVDGDTIELEIRRTFHIRLRDIDAPEKNTVEGVEATNFVKAVFNTCEKVIVFIPTNDPDKLMDVTSFERIVGDVYVDGELLQDLLKDKGFEKQ